MSGTILVVTSGKGGVGKSTTALNLGVALGVDGHSVALVDADLGMANLGGMLGVESEPTLHDVLAGDADVESAIVAAEAVEVVPGARDLTEYARADPERLPEVLRALADQHEFVVVDASAGLGYTDVMPIDAADEVVLVTTPEETAVGDTGKLVEFAGVIDARLRGVVVTRADEAVDPDGIAATVGTDLLGAVPEDPAVPESADAGVPLEHHAPDSPAATAYRRLADALTEETGDATPEDDATSDDPPEDDATSDTTDVEETTGDVVSAEANPHPEDDESGDEETPGETETAAEEEPPGEDQPAEADEPSEEDDAPEVGTAGEADAPGDGGSVEEESAGEESVEEESTGEESVEEESTGEESVEEESTGEESSRGSGGLFARLRGLF